MEGNQRWISGQSHAHLKTSWINHQIIHSSPPVSGIADTNFHKDPRISPAVLFIIVILAVLFFISGLLHLLVRFLTKSPSSSQSNRNLDESTSETLQRQLQQLFNLHDSGLDQAFIDALPVFSYKEVVGPKEPFDCAVCLCEFSENDQLRLLPLCSHAFHISCIDTWLLSNSTCPLCRGTLFSSGFSVENPIFEYDDEDGCLNNTDNGLALFQKRVEIEEIVREKGVFPVRLGKFKKMNEDHGEEVVGESSSSRMVSRRCYSMGSYSYVVGNTDLRVSLSHNRAMHDLKVASKVTEKPRFPSDDGINTGKMIGMKTDSYSVSKIWLWSKKGRLKDSDTTEIPSSPILDLSWMHNNPEGV